MGDIDGETVEWLNTLKLGEKLEYMSDFENGYYMGVIFERLNLAKGRKFKNTKDMACKFQNFKNIRDLLLQNFDVNFPIQNILFNTHELLATIKQCMLKYNRDKKQATLKQIQTFSASKIHPREQKMFASRQKDILSSSKLNQTSKFPKKIQQIEQKLQKFKGIKTKHELMALEDRKKQLEDNRRLIEQHRLFQLNKVRNNHQFIKEHERKVYDVWMKTEQIKHTRVEKDNNLKSFLDEKKNKFYQSLRDEEVNSFKQGLEAFNLNCIRQGIELEHDPDKPLRKTEDNFNKQVVMERIKDNMKIHEKQRKERIKRENKKAVDAKQANIKAQSIWNQNNLVQSYAKKIAKQIDICSKIKLVINREEAEKLTITQKMKNRTFAELPQSKIDVEQMNEQYRRRKIQYLDEQVQRLQRRQKKHKIIAENVLQALIHIVINNEQHYNNNKGFTYQQWKGLEKKFLSYEKKDKRAKDSSRFIDNSYQKNALKFINHEDSLLSEQTDSSRLKFSEAVQHIVSVAYPLNTLPAKSNAPLYMPLKLAFVGNSLSGKTTLASKISQKYGVILINPVTIIAEAFQLNKQPVIEDPKKKKDSKKPEEENPQKIALKQWGEKMMKRIANPSAAKIEHYIEAIEFKLNYSFHSKAGQQIKKEMQDCRLQQKQRYNKALKQYEQLQKKGKKDPKKVQEDQVPTEKKYFYSKGFVIDGIDLSLDNLKQIEKGLKGYIPFEERINIKGEEIKQTISNIVKVPQAIKQNKLIAGTFDLLIHIQSKEQNLQSRLGNDKPVNVQDFKPIQKFYSDIGNELTKEKAFRAVNNDTSVDQCFVEVCKVIEKYLDNKYQQISSFKTQEEEKSPEIEVKEISPMIASLSRLSSTACLSLTDKLLSIYQRYSSKICESFFDFDNIRQQFGKMFLLVQQSFINIINRPDDKAGKILNFQQNYNKLQSQKTSIVKDLEASKHLISKLDQLYDGLWVSLESKKNQAVAERQKLLVSDMLNHQIQKIIEVAKTLLQNQLNLLVELIFFIYNINNAIEGGEELSAEYLVLGVPPSLEPISSFNRQTLGSDRLDYYRSQVNECLNELPNWLMKRQKKYKIKKQQAIETMLNEFIVDRRSRLEKKMEIIGDKVRQYYLEYYCYFNILSNKMDDWIIQGIKYQNQFVYDIYKSIKRSIQQAKKSSIKDLFVKDITEILYPLSALTPNRLPIVQSTTVNHLSILSYAIFMQELRCLSSNGRIPFKLFQSYIEKRKKSKLLEEEFLGVELDIMQQYLVTDDYCNFKEVALAMLLWKFKILEEDSIGQYQGKLTGRNILDRENYQPLKEDVSFEQLVIIPGITEERSEERILKVLIFQIFRQQFRQTISIKDLVDTLRLFSQLQVYRYGDTIMMLHEATSHKHIEERK